MFSNMYFANDNGVFYWGTYMQSRANGIRSHDWIMRRTPMRINHWYGSKELMCSVERVKGQHGEKLIAVKTKTTYNDGIQHAIFKSNIQLFCAINHRGTVITLNKGHESENMLACFRNRLREYSHSYLIPMSKGNNLLNERYVLPVNPISPN